jgi:hypothetical protein
MSQRPEHRSPGLAAAAVRFPLPTRRRRWRTPPECGATPPGSGISAEPVPSNRCPVRSTSSGLGHPPHRRQAGARGRAVSLSCRKGSSCRRPFSRNQPRACATTRPSRAVVPRPAVAREPAGPGTAGKAFRLALAATTRTRRPARQAAGTAKSRTGPPALPPRASPPGRGRLPNGQTGPAARSRARTCQAPSGRDLTSPLSAGTGGGTCALVPGLPPDLPRAARQRRCRAGQRGTQARPSSPGGA